jgi:hypothetical protein
MAARLGQLALLILIVGAIGSCRKDKPVQPVYPPQGPDLLFVTARTDTTISLSWHDRSNDEDGFSLNVFANSALVRPDTLPANTTLKTERELISGTSYRFVLRAFNENGESDSAEVSATTTGSPPPEPPTNIQATPLSSTSVRVTWSRVGVPQFFLVSRRPVSGAWATVGSRLGTDSTYTDSTAGPLTDYYYRVGAQTGSAIRWSVDSAFASTPDGPPLAPDSLHASILVGTGVTLTWLDRSANETGFEIGRGTPGHFLIVIDSVGTDVTSYADNLGSDMGDYTYRVRAYNSHGASAWTAPLDLHYEICSNGIIPLCEGSYWQYAVLDSAGPDYTIQREIVSLDYPTGLDYYLVAQWQVQPSPIADTLYYLRNFEGEGCELLHYPVIGSPTPQMLYKYPAAVLDYYFVDGDCVYVAGTGVDVTVNSIVYSNCYVFQRDFDSSHSIQIYIKPETVGIVREQEFINDISVVRRDLTMYHL